MVRGRVDSSECSSDSLAGLGFLHGAYFEGLDVANALADCIEEGGCAGLPHVEEIRQ